MKAKFNTQFKTDFQHYQQVQSSRLAAFKLTGGILATRTSDKAMTMLATKLPPTNAELAAPDKLKANVECCKRVEAVQLAERLYAGVLGDSKFRFTAESGKGKGKGDVLVKNGTVIPSRQTVLANA